MYNVFIFVTFLLKPISPSFFLSQYLQQQDGLFLCTLSSDFILYNYGYLPSSSLAAVKAGSNHYGKVKDPRPTAVGERYNQTKALLHITGDTLAMYSKLSLHKQNAELTQFFLSTFRSLLLYPTLFCRLGSIP